MKTIFPVIVSLSLLLFFGCNTAVSDNEKYPANKALQSLREKYQKNEINIDTVATEYLIKLLPVMQTDTLNCSADVYWEIISRGKSAIPQLIVALTDTASTHIYNVCKQGNLNVGEVVYFALHSIVDLPEMLVTKIQFDTFDMIDGKYCWSFFDYLFDNTNKPTYQKMVAAFYDETKYHYTRFAPEALTECHLGYKIEGYYKLISD